MMEQILNFLFFSCSPSSGLPCNILWTKDEKGGTFLLHLVDLIIKIWKILVFFCWFGWFLCSVKTFLIHFLMEVLVFLFQMDFQLALDCSHWSNDETLTDPLCLFFSFAHLFYFLLFSIISEPFHNLYPVGGKAHIFPS